MQTNLTKTENDIYPYLFSSRSTKELAEIFNIGQSTMACHIQTICEKMGFENRIDLMANEILRVKGGLNEHAL